MRIPRLRRLGVALVVALWSAAPAAAAPVETVVQDDALFLHGSEPQIVTALERARSLGMTRVRLTAGWSVIAPHPDVPEPPAFDATDPAAYPAGNWNNLDRAVRLTRAAGLAPMIDIAFWAPRWATKEPGAHDRMATEIDPVAYAAFAEAVARRYSGSWSPPPGPADQPPPEPEPSPDRTILDELFGSDDPDAAAAPAPAGEPLPAVDLYTIWNEPNHPGFLRPQWTRERDGSWRVRSAVIYRAMVRAAYPRIKAAAPGSRVLIGGTASMGSSTPGVAGVPPIRFLRELACVDAQLRPATDAECANFERLPGDGWAHHPYSLRTTPDVDTRDRDKAPVAATPRLAATLRALVAAGRLAPAVADLWLTEYGYETSTPDPNAPFSLDDQARLLAQAERIATAERAVRSWPQFQLYDRPNDAPRPGARPFGDWHSGLYFNDGTPKPAAATYGVPVDAGCVAGSRGRWAWVWGRLRPPARQVNVAVEVRRPGGAWTAVSSFDRVAPQRAVGRTSVAPPPGDAVTRLVRHRPGSAYRLRWSAGDGERTTLETAPAGRDCRPAKASRAKRRAAGRRG